MTERALASVPTGAHGGDSDAERSSNPAIRLLDALRAGDDQALLAAVGQSTTIAAENMPWACRGPDEVETALREAREFFPGLTFESRTRHVGFGLVIEEARVRDEGAESRLAAVSDTGADEDSAELELDADSSVEDDGAEGPGTALAPYDEDVATSAAEPDLSHPMWDHLGPAHRMTALALWQEYPHAQARPVPLDLPVRVTVRHDDLQVHEVTLSFPAALLKRALGHEVDPREVSLSEVQSAFIAPRSADFTTHELAGPLLTVPSPTPLVEAEPTVPSSAAAQPTRRRRRRWVPILLLALTIVASAGWWFVQNDRDASKTTSASTAEPAPDGTTAADTGTSDATNVQPVGATSEPPTVTRGQQSVAPHRKPTVTLKSDLAFGFNSSSLSPEAKAAVADVARQVRRADLSGKIYVDGYTDNLGSAAYGLVLSQRRADAVSTYLQSQLLGAPVSIVSAGHGEADPLVANDTAAGRKQNRRVTITLPQP